MKKQLFIFAIALILSFGLQAQITLNQSNTDFTPGIMNPIGGNTTGFISPTAGVNQQWNFSSLVQNSSTSMSAVIPASTNFPTATYEDTGVTSLFVPNWYVKTNNFYQTSSSGAAILGFEVPVQRATLVNFTGNSLDSCIFTAQHFAYGSTTVG